MHLWPRSKHRAGPVAKMLEAKGDGDDGGGGGGGGDEHYYH